MTGLHAVLPEGYADPARASGGNHYDRRVVAGLAARGWPVSVHEVAGAWPVAGREAAAQVGRALEQVPDGGLVLVDGLLGAVAAAPLLHHADRLALVLLVHMPGPPGGPPAAVLRAARLVVTTSRWTAQQLTAEPGVPAERLVVALPGVDAAPLTAGHASGRSLLCVAAVTAAKGQDVLVRALTTMADRDWRCAFVGDLDRAPDFVAAQRRSLVKHGLEERVCWTGTLSGPALQQAYAEADLAVLPTRDESYGLVVTEALARGLPVVASDVGGVPEALGAAADGRRPGWLVPPDDAAALAAALRRWLDDAAARADLRSLARERRDSLTGWDDTVSTIAAALRR